MMAVYPLPTKFQPAVTLKKEYAYRGSTVQFGKGYTQSRGSVVFPKEIIVYPKFTTINLADKNELMAFFDLVNRQHRISWTLPDETQVKVWMIDSKVEEETINADWFNVYVTLKMDRAL
jgi:phage-related protein